MLGGDVAYLYLAIRFPLNYRGDGDADGKNSAGVTDAFMVGDALDSPAAGAVSSPGFASSTCSLCTSGISPTRCFSQEQMRMRERPARIAMHFDRQAPITRRHSNGRLARGARWKWLKG